MKLRTPLITYAAEYGFPRPRKNAKTGKASAPVDCPTAEEWKVLQELASLLKPLAIAQQMLEGQKYCANCVVHNRNVGVIENRQGYSCDLKKIYLNAKVKVRYDNAFRYFPQKNYIAAISSYSVFQEPLYLSQKLHRGHLRGLNLNRNSKAIPYFY